MTMSARYPLALAALLGILGFTSTVTADVTVAKVIGSNMVLQQGQPVNIWGWADAGEDVVVGIDGKTTNTVADDTGSWRGQLPAMSAAGKEQIGRPSCRERV